MIKLHKEGRTIVILSSLILLGVNILVGIYLANFFYYITSFISIALLVLIIRFFRVPDRKFLIDDRLILAPADGKIVAIERVHVNEFLDEERIQVSIFMSIHDVHVNYYPIGGKIVYYKYHPGKYLVARHPKSSLLNEMTSIGIINNETTLLVRQIAGFIARRIKCYAEINRSVIQGNELGFIRFGSRLDLFIPLDAQILVRINDTTVGGATPVASIK